MGYETKWTPGPWHAKLLHNNYDGYGIMHNVEGGTRRVDRYSKGTAGVFSKADACLIAAAPELVKALEDMLATFPPSPIRSRNGFAENLRHAEARAALAKARGDERE